MATGAGIAQASTAHAATSHTSAPIIRPHQGRRAQRHQPSHRRPAPRAVVARQVLAVLSTRSP
jgi:hypothetical protein